MVRKSLPLNARPNIAWETLEKTLDLPDSSHPVNPRSCTKRGFFGRGMQPVGIEGMRQKIHVAR